jgi:hypothetical protein
MEQTDGKIKPDVLKYLGRWKNSYEKARVIGEIMLFEENGKLFIHITGSESGYCPGNWETAPVSIHSYAPDTNDVVAFLAQYALEEMDAVLAMNENKGLLIIAGYFTYKKNDGRSDFFVREFFYKI